MPFITVFTPTYNREMKLKQLYDSLCQQNNKNFRWLIVDDGSTDGTEKIVNSWINEEIIDILYYKQENMGKMRAHNKGVELCETQYFLCVDSDDYIIPDAINIIKEKVCLIDSMDDVIGIILQKRIGNISSSYKFPENTFTTLHGLYASGFAGETTLVFKTNILRNYPFQVVDGEKFITEASAYDLIDQKFKYIYFPIEITICEYNDDGYTKNLLNIYRNNPCGYVNYYIQRARLYNNSHDLELAYMFTFFIADHGKRKIFRNKGFTTRNKCFGFMRYIRALFIGR